MTDGSRTSSSQSHQERANRDYLTLEERRQIREAAFEYGSIPTYGSLSPTEREKWRVYLAQRLSKDEVTPDDWQQVNSWKFPSLVWTSRDTGLRPIEVARTRTTWVDEDHQEDSNISRLKNLLEEKNQTIARFRARLNETTTAEV